jgi:hypothetical protein
MDSVCSLLFPLACARLWQIGLFPTQRPTPTEHVHGGDNAAVLVKAEGARRQPGLSQGQSRVRESMAPCLIAAAELGWSMMTSASWKAVRRVMVLLYRTCDAQALTQRTPLQS